MTMFNEKLFATTLLQLATIHPGEVDKTLYVRELKMTHLDPEGWKDSGLYGGYANNYAERFGEEYKGLTQFSTKVADKIDRVESNNAIFYFKQEKLESMAGITLNVAKSQSGPHKEQGLKVE